MAKYVSRREFLRVSALTAAGLAAAGCVVQQAPAPAQAPAEQAPQEEAPTAEAPPAEEVTMEVVHGLRNIETDDELFVKVSLPGDRPELDSAAMIFAGAEWHEREILDLFGVVFRAHPDPRRILMPDDYEGHPLRKEFPMSTPWGYRPAPETEEG